MLSLLRGVVFYIFQQIEISINTFFQIGTKWYIFRIDIELIKCLNFF